MTKATWNGVTLAESDATVVVDNNQYFPADSINKEYFKDSNTHSTCGWKGLCSYYSIEVDGQTNPDAAWYYPEPKDAAKNIAGHVAFWKGVKVSWSWDLGAYRIEFTKAQNLKLKASYFWALTW